MRILAVDDEEAGRYLLETILRGGGYEVVTAVDGIDALEKAHASPPDLVITDVLMPRMDGYKLCVRLRNDLELLAVPILVYTASFGDPADRRFAMSLGVDSFLLKPQEPALLLAEVDRLLRKGQLGSGPTGPAIDEPDMLMEYGERISQKLYQKLLELERANAELKQTMRQLNDEVQAKSRLVTELSEAVRKERETQDALIVSQERYVAAIRGANDGLWDWDLDSGSFFASPRCRDMLGLREDEPLDSIEQWFARTAPDDVERVKFEIDLHMRGLTPHFESEYHVSTPGGTSRWVLSRGQALRREDGTPYRMAGSLSDITERKRQEEELLQNAFYDTLTGLPNRSLFMDRIAFLEARRSRNQDHDYAVLFIDLDRFKMVNESLGRANGDSLLVAVTRRLEACLRTGDTASRFGGDEFAILLDEVRGPSDPVTVAKAIESALSEPFDLEGNEVYISASIGIAMTGGPAQDPGELVRDAETAMFRAKEGGRSRAEVFDTDMHRTAVAALQTEAELRRAIERGELEPYFQPVVSLKSGRMVSCEALVRWNHPERGLLGPYEFVPVAEQTGLVVPMGLIMLRAACLRNKAWQDAGLPPIRVSVNLSARQFSEPDLLDSIRSILDETGLLPRYLLLEVTESVVMQDPERAAVTLGALHEMGVSLAIDDFGTGYSSLSYLKRFPFHTLKVDRSFVMGIPRDSDDMTIVEAVVGLAHSLNLQVTAEGVETPEQVAFLRGLGCDSVQGFIVSRPVPASEFETFLSMEGLLD